MNRLKLVIPCFNEASVLVHNIEKILAFAHSVEDAELSLFLINDGSGDDTLAQMETLCERHPGEIEYLSFVTNFGKEAAIYAGLEYCQDAEAVIIMDADLEHPPELLADMVSAWREGYRVVEARKTAYNRGSHTRNYLSKTFYRSMQFFAQVDLEDESDFKLLDQEVVLQYLAMPEKVRFFKALIKWMDYDTKALYFSVEQPGGRNSRWTLMQLLRYAVNALTSFSTLPLQLITLTGFLVFLISAFFAATALYQKMTGASADGFTTVISLLALFSSGIMFSLGLIGIYIGRIYEELKDRPMYIADKRSSRLRQTPQSASESGVRH